MIIGPTNKDKLIEKLEGALLSFKYSIQNDWAIDGEMDKIEQDTIQIALTALIEHYKDGADDDMPHEIWSADIEEGSNNALCQIEKRYDYFHTKYTRTTALDKLMEDLSDEN